jgi:hypothetical protein
MNATELGDQLLGAYFKNLAFKEATGFLQPAVM